MATGKHADYLSSTEKLEERVSARVLDLAERTVDVHVVFNNNRINRCNYASVNAKQMQHLLGQLDRLIESNQGK